MLRSFETIGEPDGVEGVRGYGLSRLQRQYRDFVETKRDEREEAADSRRYYHGAHWTEEELRKLKLRGQPPVVYNRTARKVDGVVGLVERLRQDPKAYPRNPGADESSAELATACLNYILDNNAWRDLSPDVAHDGAVDGIGGLQLRIKPDRDGQNDVVMERVDPRSFFYDPRSTLPDFEDARYKGVVKWLDEEAVIDMFPWAEQEIRDHVSAGAGGHSGGSFDLDDLDRKIVWANSQERTMRLVEHWYREPGGMWCVCFYSGDTELLRSKSPFFDDQGQSVCPLVMWTCGIDHDDDRYGLVRNLKGPQQEINMRRSKGLHLLSTRRIIAEAGAVLDVEKARAEATRADGYIEVQGGLRFEFDDASRNTAVAQNFELLQEAKAEMENFGPNPALLGESSADKSGRAIQLLQQAGISELGPFLLRYRGWKVRVYRLAFAAAQQHWPPNKWVRITDADDEQQFVMVNGQEVDPVTGMMRSVNELSQLDVDIIVDEGPDQITSMAEAYDVMMSMAQVLPEGTFGADVIIELSNLPAKVKRRVMATLEKAQTPDPQAMQMQQAAQQLALESEAVKVEGDRAKIAETEAKTAATQAKVAETQARALQTAQEARKTAVEAELAPVSLFARTAPDRARRPMGRGR